ncbi:hypothetical protein SK128_007900, partial [Halocaridina rubra]
MANLVHCRVKDCGVQFPYGGSHDQCPRHSACYVDKKYNPLMKSCVHCMRWLKPLYSPKSSEELKKSAAIDIRSWANNFRRLRLYNNVSSEWVGDAVLRKLIYDNSLTSTPPKALPEKKIKRKRDRDNLEVKDTPLRGSHSSFLARTSFCPEISQERANSSPLSGFVSQSNSLSNTKKASQHKRVGSVLSLKKRTPYVQEELTDDSVQGCGNKQSIHSVMNIRKTNSFDHDDYERPNTKRICLQNRDSPSPEMVSGLPSTSNTYILPQYITNEDISDSKEGMLNTIKQLSEQITALKVEVSKLSREVNLVKLSQRCYHDSLEKKLEDGYQDIESKLTRKYFLGMRTIIPRTSLERLVKVTSVNTEVKPNSNANLQVRDDTPAAAFANTNLAASNENTTASPPYDLPPESEKPFSSSPLTSLAAHFENSNLYTKCDEEVSASSTASESALDDIACPKNTNLASNHPDKEVGVSFAGLLVGEEIYNSSAINDPPEYGKEVYFPCSPEVNNETNDCCSLTNENCLSLNIPEGSLNVFTRLFRSTDIWELFLDTKRIDWPSGKISLRVSFENTLMKDVQHCLCCPELPLNVASTQLQAELMPLTSNLVQQDKKARQRLYDIIVAIAVQEQLAQQLEEISRTEFDDSIPNSVSANFSAHKQAIDSLIRPLRDAL